MNSTEIIGTSIKIDNLEIAEFDFPYEMTWDEGVKACIELGEGWRLPTKYENNLLYQNKNKIGIAEGVYWSSTERSKKVYAWIQDFYGDRYIATCPMNGYSYKVSTYNVRAVRDF